MYSGSLEKKTYWLSIPKKKKKEEEEEEGFLII